MLVRHGMSLPTSDGNPSTKTTPAGFTRQVSLALIRFSAAYGRAFNL